MKIYINGRLANSSEVPCESINPFDRGLILGDGVFETLAVRSGSMILLDAHLSRFVSGASIIGIKMPMADIDLIDAINSVVKANDINDGIVRLTLTRGPSPRGLAPPKKVMPSLIISATKYLEGFDALESVNVVIVRKTRRNEHSPLSRIKSLNYLDNILALMEAKERGADDALLLNGTGKLVCASSSNLFVILKGKLVTPPESDGCLGGIMRAEVIRRLNGIERSLLPAELDDVSEAFLTNSLSVKPIISINRKKIGDGNVGNVVRQAQDLLMKIR